MGEPKSDDFELNKVGHHIIFKGEVGEDGSPRE